MAGERGRRGSAHLSSSILWAGPFTETMYALYNRLNRQGAERDTSSYLSVEKRLKKENVTRRPDGEVIR